MKKCFKRTISLSLCVAMLSSLLTAFAVFPSKSTTSNINEVYVDIATNTLMVKTDTDTFEVVMTESNGTVTFSQYNNGEFSHSVSQVLTPSQIDANVRMPSGSVYVGTAKYTGDQQAFEPLYHMDVKVYRKITTVSPVTYKPQNNVLTLADFANKIVSILSIPIGFANPIAGACISGATLLAGGKISWEQNKIPALSCTRKNHTYTLVHYGDAPVYYEGEEITRTGTEYVVIDKDYPERLNDTHLSGLIVYQKDNRAAIDIYNSMYYYSTWSFLEWA